MSVMTPLPLVAISVILSFNIRIAHVPNNNLCAISDAPTFHKKIMLYIVETAVLSYIVTLSRGAFYDPMLAVSCTRSAAYRWAERTKWNIGISSRPISNFCKISKSIVCYFIHYYAGHFRGDARKLLYSLFGQDFLTTNSLPFFSGSFVFLRKGYFPVLATPNYLYRNREFPVPVG